MLCAGEGWGEGSKSHQIRLDDSPLPNPLPRSTPAIIRVHLAGEGTDRAAFLLQLFSPVLLIPDLFELGISKSAACTPLSAEGTDGAAFFLQLFSPVLLIPDLFGLGILKNTTFTH
jgi:hypothetical protein